MQYLHLPKHFFALKLAELRTIFESCKFFADFSLNDYYFSKIIVQFLKKSFKFIAIHQPVLLMKLSEGAVSLAVGEWAIVARGSYQQLASILNALNGGLHRRRIVMAFRKAGRHRQRADDDGSL